MTRSACFVAALCLVAAACDKDAPAPAERTAAAPKPTTPATPTVDPTPTAPAPTPTPTREEVTKTGVLDLELVTQGDRYRVRNATFEVTFPGRPTVNSQVDRAPTGTSVTSALALAVHGNEQLAFGVTPIPKTETYDPKVGIDGARDGAIRNVGAKLVRETETTFAGLPGRHVLATVSSGGQTLYLAMHFAWDAAHHQLLMALMASPSETPSQAARDFVSSVQVKTDTATK